MKLAKYLLISIAALLLSQAASMAQPAADKGEQAATAECKADVPAARELTPGHWAACIHA